MCNIPRDLWALQPAPDFGEEVEVRSISADGKFYKLYGYPYGINYEVGGFVGISGEMEEHEKELCTTN